MQKTIWKGSKYFIDFPNFSKKCIIITTGALLLSSFIHVLILVHCMPSELFYLNCIFCYKLIQICEMSVSEVDRRPGVHLCLHFAAAKCWHFGNIVLNLAIDSTSLSTGTGLVWVETKVKENLWCLRRPSKISFEPDKSTFLSEGEYDELTQKTDGF